MAQRPHCCPHCGTKKPRLHRFGRKRQEFRDTPMHGKQVLIAVQRQRYRCRECRATFLEALPDMDGRRVVSTRLLVHVQQQSLRRMFVSIAEDTGLDERTVRRIFRDHAAHLDKTMRFETPEWLGIDEIYLLGRHRCVIANVARRTLIDMLPNRTKEFVARYLHALPNRERVEYVVMDMWQPYRDLVRELLPQARIVGLGRGLTPKQPL